MEIKGYVHVTENEAFLATVRLVNNVDFYAGNIVGYMYLDNGETLIVKQHPCGNYNASVDFDN